MFLLTAGKLGPGEETCEKLYVSKINTRLTEGVESDTKIQLKEFSNWLCRHSIDTDFSSDFEQYGTLGYLDILEVLTIV